MTRERNEQTSSPDEPTKPVSISYGKAVQFLAGGLANQEGLPNPEKRHYSFADKEVESYSEDDIELHVLMQKLKELVGWDNTKGFFDVLEGYANQSQAIIGQATGPEEMERRFNAIQSKLGMDEGGVNVEKESFFNAVRYSSDEYETDITPKLKELYDGLKSNMEYPDELPQREQVEATVNEIIDHFFKQSVKDAVAAYRNSISQFIVDKVNPDSD